MCNGLCMDFGRRWIKEEEVKGKSILEVGSYNINGSFSSFVKGYKPEKYIGVDIINGPCVDELCDAYDLIDRFGTNNFDMVISTEMMEHIIDWRKVIWNMKSLLKVGGVIMITTRSLGFPKHDHPFDYCRYSVKDMAIIFSDFQIDVIERDPEFGVFVKAMKISSSNIYDLSNYELYRVV